MIRKTYIQPCSEEIARKNILCNSEAFSSELEEKYEDIFPPYYQYSDVFNILKLLALFQIRLH